MSKKLISGQDTLFSPLGLLIPPYAIIRLGKASYRSHRAGRAEAAFRGHAAIRLAFGAEKKLYFLLIAVCIGWTVSAYAHVP